MIQLSGAEMGAVAVTSLLLGLAAIAGSVLRRRRVARQFADPELLRRLIGVDLVAVPWVRVATAGAALLALAAALLDPSLAASTPARRGSVVLLLDASGSMLVDDVGPRRIDLQRVLAESIVEELPDVPIGLVAFSGRAFSLTPPTRDAGALQMYLASLDPTIVTQSGSGLAAAIRQGIGLIGAEEGRGGTIVLLGDGDDTEDRDAALAAARLAAESGVRLHALGIGTASGGPVPALDLSTGAVQGTLRGPQGELVLSRLQDDFLRGLARRGDGIYVSGTADDAAQRLAREIRGSAPASVAPAAAIPPYAWLALAAFVMLMLEPLTAQARREV